jgi:thymidine phosphorylase
VRDVGVAVLELGGGRLREDQPIDHAVGLVDVAEIGEQVGPGGRPLATVHARDADTAERAAARLRAAFEVGDAPAGAPPLTEAVA